MALIKCKECGHEISKKAKTCPGCGAKNKYTSATAQVLFVIIFGFFLYVTLIDTDSTERFLASSEPSSPSLELSSFSCNQEYGHMVMEGEVKNISNISLGNVMAVGEFRAENNTFVKSGEALIEYNPILVGQTSPFKVITSHNPAITNCNVSFKTMFGGTIYYRSRQQ